jgi:hypothetical protein
MLAGVHHQCGFWRLGVLRCGFALAGVREISALPWLPGDGFPANAKSLFDGVFRDCHASDRPAWWQEVARMVTKIGRQFAKRKR